MSRRRTALIAVGAFGLAAMGTLAWRATVVDAADHGEAPKTKLDPAADIADFYAWHNSTTNKLVAVITFAGLQAAATGQTGKYDADVLYTVHIDRAVDKASLDNVSDIDILVRFGKDSAGAWGVQVENLPGASGTVSGAVETNIDAGNGLMVYAGLRDDPFFFDMDGFVASTTKNATGGLDLSFDKTRDTFKGTNCTAIVLMMDLTTVTTSGSTSVPSLQLWATTARK